MTFRPNTHDQDIWQSVVTHNEYGLPDSLYKPVVDIGAHIGAFAYACLKRGAPRVICVEPCPANFALLQKNLAEFGDRVTLIQAAIGGRTGRGSYHALKDGPNTGGGIVKRGGGNVRIITLAQVVGSLRDFLLKLDCEGAEKELVNDPILKLAWRIVGEYHRGNPAKFVAALPQPARTVPLGDDLHLFYTDPNKEVTLGFDHWVDAAAGYTVVARGVECALNARRSTEAHPLIRLTSPGYERTSTILMTTWESDDLPKPYRAINTKVLVVPCEHNKVLYSRYFDGPIEVLPQWGDAPFSHLPPARPFRFICVARDSTVYDRKHIDELIAWFTEAFPREQDVRLTIKQSAYCFRRYTYDKRIQFIHQDFAREDYHKLLAQHHCGIFLSGAEGWNFPAAELMAAGRPSIIIPFGGPADFTTHETSWHLDYHLVRAPEVIYQGVGKVAYPNKRGTIQAMREAYEDQVLLAQKGIASALRAAEFTEARFAARLRSIVERYGFSA